MESNLPLFTREIITDDPVVIDIQENVRSLSETRPKPNPCICKVPNYLRQVNEKVYEPLVIAIGPYHDGNKDHLKAMEDQKLWFLKKLVEEKGEADVSNYVLKMRKLEKVARNCYAEAVSLDSDDFVKMLLLEGCFIVQLIRFKCPGNKGVEKHYLTGISHYSLKRIFSNFLKRDMLLLENQLPFFVLWELFCMLEGVDHDKFVGAVFDLFCEIMPGKERPQDDLIESINLLSEINHLLGFTYHYVFHPSTIEMQIKTKRKAEDSNNAERKNQKFNMNFIRCATELEEAGVKFKEVDGNTMFDISFKNGTLYIPQITIGDHTEALLRNLIAFEQLLQPFGASQHVTDYMRFVDSLIDSPKDVEILSQSGIIKNCLGDDTSLASMTNTLGAFTVIYSHLFYYSQVFKEVNEHRSRPWNRSMAKLKHNYFNSRWAFISFLAATLLLILTLLQTVFSVLSYDA